jgi:hypothetical protein
MFKRVGVGAGALTVAALVASSTASAAIDVTEITAEIASGAPAVAAIGGAVLLFLGGVKLWKLVRRAM